MTRQELFKEDDNFCTWMLIANRESTNFEERFFEIMNPKK